MRKRSSTVRIGLVQMRAEPHSADNLEKAVAKIRQAARKGAQIICLQELFSSFYFPQTEDSRHFILAEPVPGPTTQTLSELARLLKAVLIISLFEKRTDGVYHNTAALLDADGSFLGKYRKMHIPDDPGYYEKFYFTPGDLGFQTFSTRYAKIGVLICWDQWFPEAARLTALSGAQILFYPSAIGWLDHESRKVCKAQQVAWEIIQRSHAVANGVFVASVNRVGREKKIKFWGNSFISDPFGQILAKADTEKEQVIVADCSLDQIRATRQGWPFLRDRRIDSYSALTSRLLDEPYPLAGSFATRNDQQR